MDNKEHCEYIANILAQVVDGELYYKDGDLVKWGDLTEEEQEDAETATLYDYFDDIYNIEYLINADKEYEHVRVMVACGGPNIYVDTIEGKVTLYWWSDYAEADLRPDVIDAIDACFSEVYDQ